MAARSGSGKRRRLTVPEKYQVFLEVVSGQGSQREIADKWRVDRLTVAGVCKTAKQGALDALALARPGRPGKIATEPALEEALVDNGRLRDVLAGRATDLCLKERWG